MATAIRASSATARMCSCADSARVIGRVCMDMIMADVTDIPGVSLEDEVVLMGKQGDDCISPEELARHAETIPYEIILGFSRRVRRIVEE